ncbi:YdcF family protein [archaeon]|jgi:hypothetical protein|nr:YdcF family protein [archaeon]MBT6761444.1 YdcF family protein [archaeon]
MSYQIIDAILTLGGEDPLLRARSERTFDLMQQLRYTRIGGARAILSGYCSGLIPEDKKPSPSDAEAYQMANCLEDKGILKSQLFIEPESLDTIANFVYSQPILEELGAKRIYVVADKTGMPRVLQTAKYVLGSSYTIVPSAVDEGNNNFPARFRENMIMRANKRDFKRFKLNTDFTDQEDWEDYLANMHPFHGSSKKRHLTAYGFPAFMMTLPSSLSAIPANYRRNSTEKNVDTGIDADIGTLNDDAIDTLSDDESLTILRDSSGKSNNGDPNPSEGQESDMGFDDFFVDEQDPTTSAP